MSTRPLAEENDVLVGAFVADWQCRDTQAILAYFTEDAVYHCMPLRPVVGKPALAEWVRGFEDAPPARLHVLRQVASDAVVMNERTDDITLAPGRAAFDDA